MRAEKLAENSRGVPLGGPQTRQLRFQARGRLECRAARETVYEIALHLLIMERPRYCAGTCCNFFARGERMDIIFMIVIGVELFFLFRSAL